MVSDGRLVAAYTDGTGSLFGKAAGPPDRDGSVSRDASPGFIRLI